jgi:hypothetical protein
VAEASLYPEPPPEWIGWRRPQRGRWKAVSRGESEAEAFRKLLDVADRDRFGSFDCIVLPEGQKP